MRPVEGFDQIRFAETPFSVALATVLGKFSIIQSAINTLG